MVYFVEVGNMDVDIGKICLPVKQILAVPSFLFVRIVSVVAMALMFMCSQCPWPVS